MSDHPSEGVPIPKVRARLVNGPFDGDIIDAPVVNGIFCRWHVRLVDPHHAALYESPLDVRAAEIAEFQYRNIVTWDDPLVVVRRRQVT